MKDTVIQAIILFLRSLMSQKARESLFITTIVKEELEQANKKLTHMLNESELMSERLYLKIERLEKDISHYINMLEDTITDVKEKAPQLSGFINKIKNFNWK